MHPRWREDESACSTVVGIAENIKQQSLSNDAGLTFYLAFNQTEAIDASPTATTKNVGSAVLGGLFVRTSGPADAAIERVRRDLQQVMPGAGYVTVTSMSHVLAPQMRSWQLGATMFAVFGVLALVLAAIGLYSVIAYSASPSACDEMGVRVALGAQAGDVVQLIVGEGLEASSVRESPWAVCSHSSPSRWIAPLLFNNVSPKGSVGLRERCRNAHRGRDCGQLDSRAACRTCRPQRGVASGLMTRTSGIRRLLHITRDRAGIERAVNDELQFHFDMTMRELMARGGTDA